jgi:hypothetical protein
MNSAGRVAAPWADVLVKDAAGTVVVDWDAFMRSGNHQAHAN